MNGSPAAADRNLILVVDDDPDARALLYDTLTAAGFAVMSACDGTGALALLDDIAPDLIVLDAIMPAPDGFDTCRQIKAQTHLTAIPVIFMTGLSDSEHVVMGLRSGGVDYVTKPVMLDELVARIHVHVANARLMRSAHEALDATGRRLVAADGEGRIRWATPLAASLLAGLPEETGRAFGLQISRMIDASRPSADFADRQVIRIGIAPHQIEINHLGHASGEEHFFRIVEIREGLEADVLRRALNLTPRESDVLFWIAQGKSNRDASEIMNISARTVNKHLEQIFIKLGVENRAAAAAIATRVIAMQQ